MINYLIAFVLTQIIEMSVAFIMGYRDKLVYITIFFINLITHPILHCILLIGTYFNMPVYNMGIIVLLEILVTIAEWLLLVYTLEMDKKKMFLLALAMNATSFLLGLLIFSI